MPVVLVVGIYARISLDRSDGEGVARQLADGRALATERWPGATVVEYVDNDVSAYRARRRPEFDRLLADLTASQVDVVVAYHPDRLYRVLGDLEALIDAVQAAGADVATVKAGDIDLSTASGRMVARILGSVSRHESERIGERVSRAKKGRAAQGRPAGGGKRPFGLTADRAALVVDEAAELRQAAAAVLAGASWGSEVARLNDAGVTSTTGRPWTVGTLRRVITSPHVAGLRSYRGQIVGGATWPAIIDRDTWEQLRADVATRRRSRPPAPANLLTGILECSACRRRLYVGSTRTRGRAYRCSPSPTTTGRGCGRSIAAELAEDHVLVEVRGWLADPVFAEQLDVYLAYGAGDSARARSDLDEIERQQVVLAERWAAGERTDAEYEAARAVLARRHAEADARVVGQARPKGTVTTADLLAEWDRAAEDRSEAGPKLRAVISAVARLPVLVGPGRFPSGDVVPVGGRVELLPAWSD